MCVCRVITARLLSWPDNVMLRSGEWVQLFVSFSFAFFFLFFFLSIGGGIAPLYGPSAGIRKPSITLPVDVSIEAIFMALTSLTF